MGAAAAYAFCGQRLAAFVCFLSAVCLRRLYLRRLEIRDAFDLYLTRYHLFRSKIARTFLHRIWRADKDRDVHNHPWPFAFAFILRGGYWELIRKPLRYQDIDGEIFGYEDVVRYHGPMSFSFEAFKSGNYHRIIAVQPNTWTLFFAGKRSRDWGFLTPEGHVPSRTYLGLPEDHDFGD
jgi:hypothetical protein